ncbi:UNVERIFIED_CONTAM: hypothetical protein GTU68_049894, partial [Idotea baltica]|nr:hypothetical protein [Idotea baltica]
TCLFILLLLGCKSDNKEQVTQNEKPNVLLIVVDDQGYGDVGRLGNEDVITPNIDNLYDISARFTQYHVSPTCAPTRAALM